MARERLSWIGVVGRRRAIVWLGRCLAVALVVAGRGASLAAGPELEVRVVALTSAVAAWDTATLAVETEPGAECRITVWYKSGPSRARGLVSKVADGQGRVSWSWVVGSNTTPGTWPISVTCLAGAREGRVQTSFSVR